MDNVLDFTHDKCGTSGFHSLYKHSYYIEHVFFNSPCKIRTCSKDIPSQNLCNFGCSHGFVPG